jgi:hypothetical protein
MDCPLVRQQDQLKSAKKTRGVASVDARYGDVLGDNRAGADDDTITNCNREYSGIRSDTYTIAKLGLTPEATFLCRSANHKGIINKHRAVRNEAIVPNRNELADE